MSLRIQQHNGLPNKLLKLLPGMPQQNIKPPLPRPKIFSAINPTECKPEYQNPIRHRPSKIDKLSPQTFNPGILDQDTFAIQGK
jgi:hypothetical protein